MFYDKKKRILIHKLINAALVVSFYFPRMLTVLKLKIQKVSQPYKYLVLVNLVSSGPNGRSELRQNFKLDK